MLWSIGREFQDREHHRLKVWNCHVYLSHYDGCSAVYLTDECAFKTLRACPAQAGVMIARQTGRKKNLVRPSNIRVGQAVILRGLPWNSSCLLRLPSPSASR